MLRHKPAERPLTLDDIPWTSEPVVRLEDTDILTLNYTELLPYVAALQGEQRALRRLTHEALGFVATLSDKVRAQSRDINHLRDELRRARERHGIAA